MNNKSIHSSLIFLSLGFFLGCGSGNSKDTTTIDGTWDVRYNLQSDQCGGLVLEGIPGFVDQHTIVGEASQLKLSAQSGLIQASLAQVSGVYRAQQVQTGDLLGDGSECSLTTQVTYQDLSAGQAKSLFSQIVTCDSGFSCGNTALGQAKKEPE